MQLLFTLVKQGQIDGEKNFDGCCHDIVKDGLCCCALSTILRA